MAAPLEGLVVVERAGRIATAATGYLLAQLGARVTRIEAGAGGAASPGLRRLCRGGKHVLAASGDPMTLWARLRREADVVILDPPAADATDRAAIDAVLAAPADDTIVCAISPAGLAGTDLPPEAQEPLVQALSGVMAVTGYRNGPPELVQVPVGELSAAVLACSAILGALRARRARKTGQLIDLSLIEVLADQLRTHVAMVGGDAPKDFRIGCRHPVCCPWNSYRAQDGWLLICTSSDAQWRKLLGLIGRSELNDDPRFATAATRREISDEVDAVVQAWVGTRSRDDVLAALTAIDVPVGAARTIPQVVADPQLALRGTLRHDGGAPVIGHAVHVRDDAAAPAAPLPAAVAGAAPLAGIRVVEITRFAAGPIAGLVLASLGAEVIKIESPGGEECRKWTPRFGVVSGYYANYNAGKRSVVLDLRQAEGRRGLEALVAGADVLLQNVRPGVMDEIGLGAAAATQRHARLVYASLNGYGLDGPKLAALDTVIQAEYGLTALIGDGEVPCRMGFSIADQLAGHITALGILAALTRRDATGRGGIVDTAMGDAIAWLTQLAWPDGQAALGACARLTASDGWIVAGCDTATARAALGDASGSRAELVARLARKKILAAPVLEPHEVFEQPVIRARRSVYEIATEGGGMARVLVPPLGLTGTPVLRPSRLADLGTDTAALLGADVVKLEQRGMGDPSRYNQPRLAANSYYFNAVNANKRSITIDLTKPAGREVAHRLLRDVDVVVESYRPGVAKKLGVDYETLNALNPRIIYCSISGFGQTGPLSHIAGHDLVIQGLTGLMGCALQAANPPAVPGFQAADFAGALFAVIGIQAALAQRARTQVGCQIDLGMYESLLNMCLIPLSTPMAQRAGHSGEPRMESFGGNPRYATYLSRDDKPVAVSLLETKAWVEFCKHIGRMDLVSENESLADRLSAHGPHHAKYRQALTEFCASKTWAELMAFMNETGIAICPVCEPHEVMDLPQVSARGLINEIESPSDGTVPHLVNPLFRAGLANAAHRPAPGLGQHNHQILRALGYSVDEIARLERDAVV